MSTVPRDAKFMISVYGREAAGTAMSWSLDCVMDDDKIGEAYWLEVALLVMEMQERGGRPPP